MFVSFAENGTELEVTFNHDINFETSHQLELELGQYKVLPAIQNVVIDFSKVRFIDSSGISLLLKWIHPMKNNVGVEIINASAPVQNILRICKLDQFAKIS